VWHSGRALIDAHLARCLAIPDRIARPVVPQELAATFMNGLNAGFVEVLQFQNAAMARNESRTRKSRRGKFVEFDRDVFRVAKG
jgi:hypothetical protein